MEVKRKSVYKLVILILLLSAPFSIAADRGIEIYSESLRLYRKLTSSPSKSKNKEIWETIARTFYSAYESYPNSPKAPNSLFLSGRLYEEMGNKFSSKADYETALEYSRQFVSVYSLSNLTDDAQIRVARIVEKVGNKSEAYSEYQKIVEDLPQDDMMNAARKKLKELSKYKLKSNVKEYRYSKSSKPKITKIRHWSTDDYTRVVIHVDEKREYKSKLLKADPSIEKPPRLYVDIEGTTIDNSLHVEPITKGLLDKIKFGRNTADTTRVVLYINSFENYNVFSLNNPYRIVMDIEGEGADPNTLFAKDPVTKPGTPPTKKPNKQPPTDTIGDLRQVLGLKIGTVVIDPGHGGHDPGAIGPSGVKEKDINLKIAKELKKKLERDGKKIGIDKVHLTRSSDRFIPLEERTAIAKKLKADLFISIHCNAAKDRRARGLETYILSFTNDKRALQVAARENATTTKKLSDMRDIIKKYLLNSKIEESKRFATYVQSSIHKKVSAKYKPFNNKGVKKAPFIVLIGADIPSILVETSFISNPTEEKRLNSSRYRARIAEGIFNGIEKYTSETQTASLTY